MPEPVATMTFPPEWCELPWLFTQVVLEADTPDGKAFLGGGVLDDGTNLMCLAFPGGQCLLRAPLYGELEQRFTGRELTADDEVLQRVWKGAVESQEHAGREVREMYGGGYARN